MNLLGKIFTVFIFVASLFLLFVAMVVYATHKNWREDAQAATQKLQTAQAASQALETKYQDQVSRLNAEHEADQQNVRKLQSELETVQRLSATTQREVDQLRSERRENEGLVAATEQNNSRLQEEVTKLRESIAENQRARDEAFAKTLEATTQLHVTAGQLATIRERYDQIIQQLAKATSALREGGINPDADVVVQARGKITATSRSDGKQLIEITIGSDDGVRPQQTVEIFRGERYLGRATILKSDPDRAVGQVIREFQQGQIQEGDDVATKLRVG
jgi:peptidoglycan hydrolase CwlO-like protein